MKIEELKRAGSKGGKARAENNDAKSLSVIGQKGSAKRWGHPLVENGSFPVAHFQGSLKFGASEVDCYVLNTKQRVLSSRGAVGAIAGDSYGNLRNLLEISGLKGHISEQLAGHDFVEFEIPGIPTAAKGIQADAFIEICKAFISALQAGSLSTDRQREMGFKASILLASCAKVGIEALIDEATGFQYEREEDALQVKLRAYIAEELRAWEKTFPDQLWEEFGRLTDWKGRLHSRPKWWGKLVMELIYDALDPDIARHLREHKPPPRAGMSYHQWMTADVGLKALIPHIYQVIGIAKTCRNMKELREKVRYHYGKEPFQLSFAHGPAGSDA